MNRPFIVTDVPKKKTWEEKTGAALAHYVALPALYAWVLGVFLASFTLMPIGFLALWGLFAVFFGVVSTTKAVLREKP